MRIILLKTVSCKFILKTFLLHTQEIEIFWECHQTVQLVLFFDSLSISAISPCCCGVVHSRVGLWIRIWCSPSVLKAPWCCALGPGKTRLPVMRNRTSALSGEQENRLCKWNLRAVWFWLRKRKPRPRILMYLYLDTDGCLALYPFLPHACSLDC